MAVRPLSYGNLRGGVLSRAPTEEKVPCFLQDTIHLLLPCGPFSPASLNSFYYLIHGITILILRVDLN